MEWANQETKRHYGWHINHILHPICLQNTDKKASQKQRTAKLKENIDRIKSGGLKVVINEAVQTQQKLLRKKKAQRKRRKPNWITTIRSKVQEGELNSATRILKDDTKSILPPTDEIFQRMTAMFPRRREKERRLPQPNPQDTKLTHFKANDIQKAIMTTQGSGGPSHLDAKSLRRVVTNKVFVKQSQKITNTLAAITNKMSAQPMMAEDIEPLLAVRMIEIEKTEKEFRPVGIGEIIKRVIAKVIARAIEMR